MIKLSLKCELIGKYNQLHLTLKISKKINDRNNLGGYHRGHIEIASNF